MSEESTPITPVELLETLRALKSRIPEFTQISVPDEKSARVVANLHPQFKVAAINAVGLSEIVARAVGMTAEEMRKLNQDTEEWSEVIDELRNLLKGVTAANFKRRHRVGLASLQSYSITRQLVRHEDHADLLPQFYEMKQTSRFGRRRRKETIPAPLPTPQTADPMTR